MTFTDLKQQREREALKKTGDYSEKAKDFENDNLNAGEGGDANEQKKKKRNKKKKKQKKTAEGEEEIASKVEPGDNDWEKKL